jgi:hypothetical protein
LGAGCRSTFTLIQPFSKKKASVRFLQVLLFSISCRYLSGYCTVCPCLGCKMIVWKRFRVIIISSIRGMTYPHCQPLRSESDWYCWQLGSLGFRLNFRQWLGAWDVSVDSHSFLFLKKNYEGGGNIFSPKFHYAKRRFSITSKCQQMHGVLNVDEIKN